MEEKEAEKLEEPLNPEPEKPRKSAEDARLGGRPPLKTVLILAIGPILSQMTNALFGVITTLWVSKAIGEDGMTAVSSYNVFEGMGRAVGFFLSVAASTQVSALFGKGEGAEATQVMADLLRSCLVFGSLVPAILLPALKPCIRWFGAEEKIIDMGFQYMLPLTTCAPITCLYLCSGGCLQGEGRTMLFGLTNVGCLCLNMLVLNPIFLFGFKTGIWGASTSTVISEFVPAAIIITLYFACKKFGMKPTWSQLCKKFSSRTWIALRVGSSQLISMLSVQIPSILIRKYIGKCTGPEGYNDAMAGFNAAFRCNMVSISIFNAFSMGYIPAASYAYAAKKYRRWFYLTGHLMWLCSMWGVFTCIFTYSIPRQLGMIFSNSEGYLAQAERQIRIINAAGPVAGFRFNCQAILQSMHRGGRAMSVSLINNFLTISALVFVLYYTNKTDGARMILCYPISYALAVPLGSLFLISPMRETWRLYKEEMQKEKENELNDIEAEEEKIVNPEKEGDGFVDPLPDPEETTDTDAVSKA